MRKLCWLLILAFAPSASATIALVGCNQNTATATNTVTVTRTTSSGNLLTLSPAEGTDNTTTWTVADTATNTWNQTTAGYATDDGGNNRHDIRYVANAGSITSVTVTFSSSPINITAILCEWSGAATSSVQDTSVNISGSGFVTSLTSGVYTTTNANDLLLYCVRMSGSVTAPTAGGAFTIPTNGTSGGRHSCQYNIVSSIQSSQTTSMSWTSTARASGAFAAFSPPALAASGKKPIIIQ